MKLSEELSAARDHFSSMLGIVNKTLGGRPEFLDSGRQQARAVFREKLNAIFAADFQPVVVSAASVADKLTQLVGKFASQKEAYSAIFPDEVDSDTASRESVAALEDSFKKILA